MSDRLAGAHFAAIAPDLYHRDDPNSSDDPLTRMGRLRDVAIVADVNAAIEHTKGLPEVEADRIGITGYCMGGRVTYLMAAKNRNLKAAVVCWGGNIMVPWGEGPAPFDLSKDIDCPVLGLFGEEDPNPNPADVAKLDAELTNLSKTHEFHSYTGGRRVRVGHRGRTVVELRAGPGYCVAHASGTLAGCRLKFRSIGGNTPRVFVERRHFFFRGYVAEIARIRLDVLFRLDLAFGAR